MPTFLFSVLTAAVCAATLLCPVRPALAQEPKSLALHDLLATLLDEDEAVQAAMAAHESSLHQVESAKGLWRPTVDVNLQAGYEEIYKSIQEPKDQSTAKFRNEQDLTVTQLIYDFGGTSGRIRMYEALNLEAQARLEQARQNALYRGVNAYLMVVRYREILKYLNESEQRMVELSGIQEALVERGSGISPDELRVKAQLANVLAEKLRAEQQYRRALHNFKSVFELELTQAMVDRLQAPAFPSDFVPADVEPAVAQAFDSNPALLEMMQAMERSKHQLDVQESVLFPTLQFVGEAQRKEQDQGIQGLRNEVRATLQMTYTLYNGGSDTEDVAAARENVVAAKKTVLEERDTVEEAVRNAYSDMVIIRQQHEQYRNQTNITYEYLSQLKRIQEAGGDVDLTAILIGERDYLSATSSMVTAEIDTSIAAYTLLFQMGKLSTETVNTLASVGAVESAGTVAQ